MAALLAMTLSPSVDDGLIKLNDIEFLFGKNSTRVGILAMTEFNQEIDIAGGRPEFKRSEIHRVTNGKVLSDHGHFQSLDEIPHFSR